MLVEPKRKAVRSWGFIAPQLESSSFNLLQGEGNSQFLRVRYRTSRKEVAPIAPRGDESRDRGEDLFEVVEEKISFLTLPGKGRTVRLDFVDGISASLSIRDCVEKLGVAVPFFEPVLLGSTTSQDLLIYNNLNFLFFIEYSVE